jgi:hypothetical protein
MAHPTVVDWDGLPVVVGARVHYFDTDDLGTVTGFTDWDADVDDDGRGYSIAPTVGVRWDDGTSDHYATSEWTSRWVGLGPDAYQEPDVGKVEELVVVAADTIDRLTAERDRLRRAVEAIAAGPQRTPRTSADYREALGEAVEVAQRALIDPVPATTATRKED